MVRAAAASFVLELGRGLGMVRWGSHMSVWAAVNKYAHFGILEISGYGIISPIHKELTWLRDAAELSERI